MSFFLNIYASDLILGSCNKFKANPPIRVLSIKQYSFGLTYYREGIEFMKEKHNFWKHMLICPFPTPSLKQVLPLGKSISKTR